MQAYCCKVLLCVTALFLASSAAEARYWRHYGSYHWYGRTWNGSPSNSDERQVEKRPPGTEPENDSRNQVGEFGSAIEQMVHGCDRQAAELKEMPLDGVAGMRRNRSL
jgi:hypothetical protein